MFYVASREGQLPEVLSMIHIRRHTPLAAVLTLVRPCRTTRMHTHQHAITLAYTHQHIHNGTYTPACNHTGTYTPAHAHQHAYTSMLTHQHAYILAHTHQNAYTSVLTHQHTYTPACIYPACIYTSMHTHQPAVQTAYILTVGTHTAAGHTPGLVGALMCNIKSSPTWPTYKYWSTFQWKLFLICILSVGCHTLAKSNNKYLNPTTSHWETIRIITLRLHTPQPLHQQCPCPDVWCVCVCVCVCAQYPMTLLQLFVGDIYSLLNFMSFLRWLFIGMAVLGLIYLRFTQPDLPRPFKVRVITCSTGFRR